MEIVKVCYNCKKEEKNMSTCSKCKIILYCSRECQKQDWERHKATCNRDQKPEGLRNKQVSKILSENEKFIKVMGAICNMHWKKDRILCLSLVETEFMAWKGTIESFPLDQPSTTSKDKYDFTIHVLEEKNVTTHDNLMIGIPVAVCKKFLKELSGIELIKMPINIIIGHDQICIFNQKTKIKYTL